MTFESDDDSDDLDLEYHFRGPEIARVLGKIYGGVREKAQGSNLLLSRAVEPETEAVTWTEVLEFLDEHTSNISDLL